ncbi:glycosyltransferase family 22 protein [Amylocystis lapponica]|nr:glycosyltransferase family 22 protein [Amylocystis lapponica]
MSTTLDLLLLATGWLHVVLSPFTKVEESFNLHATHDVLMYGLGPDGLKHYDHFLFPGAVPRTFIGSVSLAWLSTPIIHLACRAGLVSDKFDLQIIVRLVLATVNAVGFCLLRRAVSRRFGGPSSVFFVVLTCTQFHIPFWMGRTLPNMFALFPVNLALYNIINHGSSSLRPSPSNVRNAITLLTFTTVVIRSEVLLLLGPLVLQFWYKRYITFSKTIKTGLIAGVNAVALTFFVDSYSWQQWVWPEFYAIYFNVFLGKSAEWGVSPYYAYFIVMMPRVLLSSTVLLFAGLYSDQRIRALLFPAGMFLMLISALGHKEWRFVVYVVPLFNIAAARGAVWLTSQAKKNLRGRLCFLLVAGCIAANCILTTQQTYASIANYPGGEALARLNARSPPHDRVHVHISNLAAQTGASLFLHTHAPPYAYGLAPPPARRPWVYDKTEHLAPAALSAARNVSHVIAEAADAVQFSPRAWAVVERVDGFAGWRVNPRLWPLPRVLEGGLIEGLRAAVQPLEMVRREQLVVLQRTG